MSSAMKNRDNPFGWTTTVIICKRWFKNQVKHYLYLLLCAERLVVGGSDVKIKLMNAVLIKIAKHQPLKP
jgi:hypothetical protein